MRPREVSLAMPMQSESAESDEATPPPFGVHKCALKAHNQVRYDPERSTTCGGSQTGDQLCCRELAANLIYYDYFYHSVGLSLFTLGSADKTVRNNVQTEVRTSVPSTYLTSSPLCGINRTVLRIEYLKESFILPSLQY